MENGCSAMTLRGLALGLACTLAVSLPAAAGSLEQAKRIHDRLAGVPPSESVLLQMKTDIDNGDAIAAARLAMDNDSFYNVTVKNWASPWTNRDFDVFVPLNDYTATVVGLVRDSDQYDFREVLYGDHLYVGKSSLGLAPYSNTSNAHYEQLESGGYSLKDNLVHMSQASVTGLPADATAGVITTRAAAKAFFINGTNRAQFRFTMINYLCRDLEQVHDITRTPDRIRQDVSRSPGGDSRVFLNTCQGCHAGMDPMAQAFAYYNYQYDADTDVDGVNGQIQYYAAGTTDPVTGSRVQPKYLQNSATFPQGYVTPNDHWTNYWREGQNASLGWDQSLPGSGDGARSMLEELSHSDAFASCQVKKVFKAVCLREPQDQNDRDELDTMKTDFIQGGYDIKDVFAESAVYCSGS